MFNLALGRMGRVGNITGIQRAIAFLRSLGTNAHVWLPGANGTTVASLPSNNYLLSDGSTGYSTVDGVDGLTLDGMGSLGAEKVTNGTFDSGITGWSATAATTLTWDASGKALSTAGNTKLGITQTRSFTAGNTYVVTATITNNAGSIPFSVYSDASYTSIIATSAATTVNVASPITIIFVAPSGLTAFTLAHNSGSVSGGKTAYFDNISVKEYTGTHLTQATTANKPLVRRGMLNLLTYSNDLSNAVWAVNAGSKTGNQVTLTASVASNLARNTLPVTVVGATYTMAALLSTTSGTMDVRISRTDGTTWATASVSPTITLTTTPTLYALTYVAVGAATSDFVVGGEQKTPFIPSAKTFIVGGAGLFQGTWTAAQILAEGGIPTTTATAASNPSAGKYWWSFDGSNDSLLSGNLGITNACTIVIALRFNALSTQVLLCETTNGVQVYVLTDGSVTLYKTGVVGVVVAAAGTVVAGVPCVLTLRLSSGTAVIRKNGVQVATNATAHTFSATTGMAVGSNFAGGQVFNGAIGWVVPLPTALSDADCLTVERLVGSQFPGMATF